MSKSETYTSNKHESLKGKEIMANAAVCPNLEITVISEISQLQKAK